MARQLPSLSALRAFEAAARHESFKLAAQELGITATAVSHQIKQLELALGQALFIRQVRQVRLTDPGRGLAVACRQGFDTLAAGVAKARALPVRQTVTLGLGPMIASKWLAPRLARFWQACPGIDLRLHHLPPGTDGRHAELDLAIVWGDGRWPGAAAEPLLRIRAVPVASPKLLGRRRPPLSPEALLAMPLLHQRDREAWEAWCEAAGLALPEAAASVVIEDAHVVLQAAIDGQGVALGGLPMIADDLAAGRLVRLHPLAVAPRRAYYLVVPGGAKPGAEIERVRGWLYSECAAAISGPATSH